jgi:hypothetical protein
LGEAETALSVAQRTAVARVSGELGRVNLAVFKVATNIAAAGSGMDVVRAASVRFQAVETECTRNKGVNLSHSKTARCAEAREAGDGSSQIAADHTAASHGTVGCMNHYSLAGDVSLLEGRDLAGCSAG